MPLAQVVDRRVRHLREALAEVRVERPGAAGEQGQRGVVAHRGGRLVTAARDRAEDDVDVLARVAEGRLAGGQVALRRLDRRPVRAAPQALVEPAPVRLPRGEPRLDRAVLLEAPVGIDGDDLPGAEPAAADRPAPREVDGAGLGRADDEAVGTDRIAQRPQSVAVERGADDAAVGEDEPGRTVPRLDQQRVVAVVVAQLSDRARGSRPRPRARASSARGGRRGRGGRAARARCRASPSRSRSRRTTGWSSSSSSEPKLPSRARIQLTLPWIALISPL